MAGGLGTEVRYPNCNQLERRIVEIEERAT
jgi:hypothetical protein